MKTGIKINRFSCVYDFNTLRTSASLTILTNTSNGSITFPAGHYKTAQSVIDKIQELTAIPNLYLRVGLNGKLYIDSGAWGTYTYISFSTTSQKLARLLGLNVGVTSTLTSVDDYFPNLYNLRPVDYIYIKTDLGLGNKLNNDTSDLIEVIPFDFNSNYSVNYEDYARFGYSQILKNTLNNNFNIYVETDDGERFDLTTYVLEFSVVAY